MLLLLILLACSGGEATRDDDARGDGPSGWGAVFWRDGVAVRLGEGDRVLGRGGAATVTATGETGVCDGTVLPGAPPLARLALAGDGPPPELPAVPKVQADLARAAAVALHPTLPADRFTPHSEDPERLHGIDLGSVVKTRRELAPPVLLVSAHREGTAAIAVLSRDATEVHEVLLHEGWSERAHLLPAADLDGDGLREVALYGPRDLALYRLDESGRHPRLQAVHHWRCPEADGGPEGG